MKKILYRKKEIHILFFAFLTVAIIVLALRIFTYFQSETIHQSTVNVYKYPFKVSNASINLTLGVYKMHRDMKDIVLSSSREEFQNLVEKINHHEQNIYENLNIIENQIVEKEGLELQRETLKLFQNSKPIRDKVIELVKKNKISEAIAITKNRGARQVLKLEESAQKLYLYAKKKADELKDEADVSFYNLKFINNVISVIILFLFLIIAYYTLGKISKYINKNEHLNGVLSVVRDVNQLIIREKEASSMLQESCNILVSNHIYLRAWIMTVDDEHQIKSIISTDSSENFESFKEKVKNDWNPYCVNKTDKKFSYISNTGQTCIECPLKGIYDCQGAFNIELKYDKKLYGYLNISVDEKYVLESDELALLDEVAGDIAYALHNLEIQELLVQREERYRFIVEGSTDGFWDWNLLSNDVYYSPRWKEILGYSNDELKNSFESWEDRLHPDDKKQAFIDVKLSQEGKTKQFHNLQRLKHKDGHWVWIISRAQTIFDENGKAVRMIGSHTDITELKESENKLKISNEKFEKAFTFSPIIIAITNLTTGRIYDVNKAFETAFGYTKEDLVGKTTLEIGLWHDNKDRVEYIKNLDRYHHKGGDVYEFNHKNNKIISARMYGSLITVDNEEYILSVAEDITEKRKISRDLFRSNSRYKIAERIGKVGSWEYSIETQEFWASDESKRIYGFPIESDSFSVEMVENCIPERERVHQALIDLLKKGVDYNLEFEVHPFDGSAPKTISSIAKVEFDKLNKPLKITGFIQDITEQKHKDELIINQSRHAAMGEMISMIAHQWRQPLSVISMSANNMLVDIAIGNFDMTASEEYAKNISKHTQHLSQTIDDFRNFFKPDKEILKVNMKDILSQTLSIVKDNLRNNNIEFTSFFETDTPVNAYPRELMQVFVNIITNSKDALLSKKQKNSLIRFKVYEDKKYVNVEICDNGGGIKSDILPKIFDPYFSTKDKKTGTGLGLYMSKMIIEDHLNGIIETKNKDEGACFTVRLLKTVD